MARGEAGRSCGQHIVDVLNLDRRLVNLWEEGRGDEEVVKSGKREGMGEVKGVGVRQERKEMVQIRKG